MPGHPRSLVSGDTAALRRVVALGTAAVVAGNGAPSTSDQQMVARGRYAAIDLIAQCAGAASSYAINVWWWYEAAQLWVLDDTIGTVAVTTAGGTVAFPLLNNPNNVTADGIYIRILNGVDGGGGVTADVWLQGNENSP